tara:strand:+ start:221 stop:1339 length:1119 start_codon:yes stop_codon:yes gene_type:complete
MAGVPTLFDLNRKRAASLKSFLKMGAARGYGRRSQGRKVIGNINSGYKSHYAGIYPNGTASNELLFPDHYTEYWDAVTCNNPFKWRPNQSTTSQSNSGTFNFNISGAADYVYNYTIDNGMDFIWHNLLWGANQGYPEWLVGLSEADTKAAFDNWLSAIANKYPKVSAFAVLNEVYPGHQSGTASLSAQFGGAGSTGYDWIIYIFERAKHYFPNAVRYINEYGTLGNQAKRQYIIDIVKLLKERDLISGVGLQSHYFNIDRASGDDIRAGLDDYKSQLDLPLFITELDLSGHAHSSGSYDTSSFSEELQLERYQRVFPIFHNHSHVRRITLWGYIISETWRYDSQNIDTGLINRDGTGKRKALTWLEDNYLHL